MGGNDKHRRYQVQTPSVPSTNAFGTTTACRRSPAGSWSTLTPRDAGLETHRSRLSLVLVYKPKKAEKADFGSRSRFLGGNFFPKSRYYFILSRLIGGASRFSSIGKTYFIRLSFVSRTLSLTDYLIETLNCLRSCSEKEAVFNPTLRYSSKMPLVFFFLAISARPLDVLYAVYFS